MATAELAALIDALCQDLDRFTEPAGLKARLIWMLERTMRRTDDQELFEQSKIAIEAFFAAFGAEDMDKLRRFCREVMTVAVEKRAPRGETISPAITPSVAAPAPPREEANEEVDAGPDLEPPRPSRHPDFPELLAAALVYRIRHVTTFFLRRNSHLERPLPPFLLSPEFDRRFETVITDQIAPAMLAVSRFVGAFEHGRSWKRVDTAEFWEIVGADETLDERLMATWRSVWADLKPKRDPKTARVVASKALVQLRQTLAPGQPPAYVLAKVDGDMLNLFGRLLSDLRPELEQRWDMLSQRIQQEVPGDSRHLHRPGGLLEAMTAQLQALPGRLGEYLVLLCHYNFAKINTDFLYEIAESSIGAAQLIAFLNGET